MSGARREADAPPLGLASGVVQVVEYDPRWPALFAAEARRIVAAVAAAGLPPLALEHVGSTAVPGLPAKPVLDIAAGRPAEVPAARYVGALAEAGYLHRGESGLPGREFFRRGSPRSHHVHLVAHGGERWVHYLAFRDALRADPGLRDAYAAVKRELAARHPGDREAYTEGKSDFVLGVLARARGVGPAAARRVDGGTAG